VSGRKHELARRKGPYSQAFMDEAVRMVLDGDRPVAHVARELECTGITVRGLISRTQRAPCSPSMVTSMPRI
jgi:transposase-like protein